MGVLEFQTEFLPGWDVGLRGRWKRRHCAIARLLEAAVLDFSLERIWAAKLLPQFAEKSVWEAGVPSAKAQPYFQALIDR